MQQVLVNTQKIGGVREISAYLPNGVARYVKAFDLHCLQTGYGGCIDIVQAELSADAVLTLPVPHQATPEETAALAHEFAQQLRTHLGIKAKVPDRSTTRSKRAWRH